MLKRDREIHHIVKPRSSWGIKCGVIARYILSFLLYFAVTTQPYIRASLVTLGFTSLCHYFPSTVDFSIPNVRRERRRHNALPGPVDSWARDWKYVMMNHLYPESLTLRLRALQLHVFEFVGMLLPIWTSSESAHLYVLERRWMW